MKGVGALVVVGKFGGVGALVGGDGEGIVGHDEGNIDGCPKRWSAVHGDEVGNVGGAVWGYD